MLYSNVLCMMMNSLELYLITWLSQMQFEHTLKRDYSKQKFVLASISSIIIFGLALYEH